MFPCTYFTSLGRVDNLDVIPETRLNKYLQLCNQYYALDMERAVQIDVFGWFFNLAFSGTYQWVFSIFPENDVQGNKSTDDYAGLLYTSLCIK